MGKEKKKSEKLREGDEEKEKRGAGIKKEEDEELVKRKKKEGKGKKREMKSQMRWRCEWWKGRADQTCVKERERESERGNVCDRESDCGMWKQQICHGGIWKMLKFFSQLQLLVYIIDRFSPLNSFKSQPIHHASTTLL